MALLHRRQNLKVYKKFVGSLLCSVSFSSCQSPKFLLEISVFIFSLTSQILVPSLINLSHHDNDYNDNDHNDDDDDYYYYYGYYCYNYP